MRQASNGFSGALGGCDVIGIELQFALSFESCQDRKKEESSSCKDIGQEAGPGRDRAPFDYACLSSEGAGGKEPPPMELLVKHGYDDLGVVEFMTKGVPLVGMHDTPRCYPELLRPATMTEEDLRRSAICRRKAMLARVHTSDPSHVKHLLETSEEELSLGFLEGPFFDEKQVTEFLGRDDWSLIRRFVLVQANFDNR